MENGLILFLVFIVFSVCVDLSGYLRAKTDTERGNGKNIDYQRMREFKRIYKRCKHKWSKDKNLVLYRKFGSFDNYLKIEFDKIYEWEDIYFCYVEK